MIFVVIAVIIMLAIDWLIVMGADPRRWKGDANNEHSGTGKDQH